MVSTNKPGSTDNTQPNQERSANLERAGLPTEERDDGWWESVLADEERFSSSSGHRVRPLTNVTSTGKSTQQADPVGELPQADWVYAEGVYKQDQIISLRVSGHNRGGLLVENDKLHGFVPYSHLVEMTGQTDLERENFLAEYVGKDLRLKIIECVPEEGRVVFSERAARADAGRRTELFSNLKQGEIVSGEVTNITEFGGFIDLGGVEGLIHISELSWGRVLHPSHILKLGQTVRVQIIEILPERSRIALSLKRLQPNPWETVSARYTTDDIVPATITSVVSYGVFARLDEGLEGLVHVSEMDLDGAAVRDIYAENERIKVRILHLDPHHQRLGLSLKLDGIPKNV
ncbi:MAG: S1 RNA-binding domain-containing protein [Chloroflexi bacterium]|nr:S1 RNA-binding domain-containing protein [Chloroflexota bacterium]